MHKIADFLAEERISNLIIGVILIIVGIALTIPSLVDWLPYQIHPWNEFQVMVNFAVKGAVFPGLLFMGAGVVKLLLLD